MAQFTDSRLANMAANAIYDAFGVYRAEFKDCTRRSKQLFEVCDWLGAQENARARLDLYRQVVDDVEVSIRDILEDRINSQLVWASAKAVYSGLIVNRNAWEQAETFFNSVTRRVFTTVGVDEQIEFVATDFDSPPSPSQQPVYCTFNRKASTQELFAEILTAFELDVPYQDLARDCQYLAASNDKFKIARGEKGMVMAVFAMPAYDVVFKIIKDRFAYPKKNTRQDVMDKYRLVFRHDRAGRLIDAQEFEFLQFERHRFDADLLEELLEVAANTVCVEEEFVVIKHCYVERAIIPLNLYLTEATEEAATHAALDYGRAIKDMAITNIFPGDMLLKNFGVSRHGRVIFYDYDELCLLETCNFRKIPQSAYYEDDFAAEPWFPVADNDYFPEEFEHFMGLNGRLRAIFHDQHSDLFDYQYWQSVQERIASGEVIDIFPYSQKPRLHK